MGEEDMLRRRLRTMQLIALALTVGAAVYFVVALLMVANKGGGLVPGGMPVLTWVAVGFVALNSILARVVPALQTPSAVRQIAAGNWRLPPGARPEDYGTETAKLLAVRQTGLLMSLAMLEGAAFLGGAAYLIDGQVIALAAMGVGVALMLTYFPTEQGVRAWLERQAVRLAELRHGGAFPSEGY